LDWEEREPESKDLVVVEMNDGKRYVRRIWIKEDKTILLEGANPTKPYEPVHVVGGNCKVRRIVGVMYDNVQIPLGGEGEEWVPASLCDGWFDRIVGVRVHGTSLEPVARNGQIVLIEKTDLRGTILNDMLACVSVKAHLSEFVLLSKAEYEELLKRTGFFIQESQRSIFDEVNRRKKPHKKKK